MSASLSVEKKSSKGRAKQSSLPFDCSWDTLDLIFPKRKPLRDNVHLLVSFTSHDILKATENMLLSNQEKAMRIVDQSLSWCFHSLGL